MQAILFQVDQMFHLVFITSFVTECVVALSRSSMESVREQRIHVKFCFKVGKTAAETRNMLREAYSDDPLSQTTTYEWFKRFKNGRTLTDDDEWPG
jgi:hypothetical protein